VQVCEANVGRKKCYVDCTSTIKTGVNTGIQRVVMNIVERLPGLSDSLGIYFVPVIAVDGKFYSVDLKKNTRPLLSRAAFSLITYMRNMVNEVLSWDQSGDASIDLLHCESIKDSLHSRIVRVSRKIIPKIFKFAYIFDKIINDRKPIVFCQNDTLFMPDSLTSPDLYTAITKSDLNGVTIVLLVHDIIPLNYSKLFNRHHYKNYETFFNILFRKSNLIVTVSKTVMDDVIKYTKEYNADLKFDYAYLGADFATCGGRVGNVRDSLKSIFNDRSIYLVVGTIEPRKNHVFILNAFHLLWDIGVDISLCIVGRVGWISDDIVRQITGSRYLGKKLFFFTDLNDGELDYCYEHIKALIFASVTEGFGLPLVEAMHYGKPVFASDIPVFREIGGEYPYYFSLSDVNSLSRLVKDFEYGFLSKDFKPQQWLSWDESVSILMRKVVAANSRKKILGNAH
jgi:alpha-1,2-rhamnosyltransferase